MNESLGSRVRRLVSGTVNAIVDQVESLAPEVVMEEAIREMGKAIDDVRLELGRVIARQHQATRRLATENQHHEELSEQIRLAVTEGREDLAEAGVERLLDIEAQIPVLQQAIADTRSEQTELEGFIAALQARQREMRFELKEYRAAKTTAAIAADTGGGTSESGGASSRADRADQAFDRIMSSSGGFASSGAPIDAKSAALRTELEDLHRQNRIKERLAELKGEVAG